MKTHGFTVVGVLLVVLAESAFCQTPPPNDNFANRITLTGNNVTFTGTLSNATVEAGEPTAAPSQPNFPATHSVWWTWTATESTPVTLVALSYSEDTWCHECGGDYSCALAVYPGTNIFGGSASNSGTMWLNSVLDKLALTFQAVAGTTYQIQFFGILPTLTATFQLVATNAPVILAPPTDQTVFPNGSAFFAVLASSITPALYQWRHNDVDLPGQTLPMLALNYVTSNDAGAYSVVVSNSTGVAVSMPAMLAINPNPVQPLLTAFGRTGSNFFAFSLASESGRYYQIESSTNLSTWQAEYSFPATLAGNEGWDAVYTTNAVISLSVPQTSNPRFYRASLYSPPNEVCNNNMKLIRFAKILWARDQPLRTRIMSPIDSDLQPYLPYLSTVVCPLDVDSELPSYSFGDLLTYPACYYSWTHYLQEP